jgi:hypothetical protein
MGSAGYRDWPFHFFTDAEALCRAEVQATVDACASWYPVSAPVAVEYKLGISHELFSPAPPMSAGMSRWTASRLR